MAWDDHESTRNRTLPPDWRARRARVLARDRNTCQVCHADPANDPADQVDHKLAVAAGGDHEDDNLQAAHTRCVKDKTQAEAQAGRRRNGRRRPIGRPHPGFRPPAGRA